jgi:hypothetical protein
MRVPGRDPECLDSRLNSVWLAGCVNGPDVLQFLPMMSTRQRAIHSSPGIAGRPSQLAGLPGRSFQLGRTSTRLPAQCRHSAVCLAFRWKYDAEDRALVLFNLLRGADVSATVRRHCVHNPVLGNSDPFTIHLDFIMVTIHATLSRTTIRVVTARAAVFYEAIVEVAVPFFVADPKVSFLGDR